MSDFTCMHHNDRARAACPVCLVTTLTAERDQLRAEVKSCGELSCDECNARTAALTAERDQLRAKLDKANAVADARVLEQMNAVGALRAEVERLEAICADHYAAHSAASQEMVRLGLTGDVRPGKMLHDAIARAERAEADVDQLTDQLTDGLRDSEAALALNTLRAERAEAEVEIRKEDNKAMGYWIAGKMLDPEWDSFKKSLEVINHWKARAERAEAELAKERATLSGVIQLKMHFEAELASERARLDWLESSAATELQSERGWIDRAAIDAAMKEGA